jgi:hypothetical protein
MKSLFSILILYLCVFKCVYAQEKPDNLALKDFRISFDFGIQYKHYFSMNSCKKNSTTFKTPTPPSSGIPSPLDYVNRTCKNSVNYHFELLAHYSFTEKLFLSCGLGYYNRADSYLYDLDSVRKYTLLIQNPPYTSANSYYEHYSFSNSIIFPLTLGYIVNRFVFNVGLKTTVYSFPFHIYWYLDDHSEEFFEKSHNAKLEILPSIKIQYVLNYKNIPVIFYIGADRFDIQSGFSVSFINSKKGIK